MADIYEWRGCSDLVLAEVLADDNATPTIEDPNHGYVVGEVFEFAGLARVNKAVESSSDAHYYNNLPCVVVTGEGPDTITLDVSAVPLDIRAKVTGQQYSTATGTMIECERKPKMWALGYKTQNTKGETIFVWRLKGSIQEGDLTNETRNNSTDANGETWTYTGISTTHKFTNMPDGVAAPAKAVNTNATLDLIADPDEYFATVQTPDTITAKSYIPSVTVVPSRTEVTAGENVTLQAIVVPAGTAVSWSSSSTTYATVANGVVHGEAAGSATITATITVGGQTYTDTCAVTVNAIEA